MKQVWFFFAPVLWLLSCSPVHQTGLSESEKSRQQEQAMADLITSVEKRNFLFTASHAIPVSGGSIALNATYDVTIQGDTINSYLPYFGVAYHADYGSRNSALDFKQRMENYELEQTKKGYLLKISVKNGMDQLRYTFQFSGSDNVALNVNSTNRQPISFFGRFDPPKNY